MLMKSAPTLLELENTSEFIARHIGIDAQDEANMLSVVGAASREALIEAIVPRSIARKQLMDLPHPATEAQALADETFEHLVFARHGLQLGQSLCFRGWMGQIHRRFTCNAARHDGIDQRLSGSRTHHTEHVHLVRSINANVAGDELGGVF